MSGKSILSKTYALLITGIALLTASVILMMWSFIARICVSMFTNGTVPYSAFIIFGLCAMFVSGVAMIIISINNIRKLPKAERT